MAIVIIYSQKQSWYFLCIRISIWCLWRYVCHRLIDFKLSRDVS